MFKIKRNRTITDTASQLALFGFGNGQPQITSISFADTEELTDLIPVPTNPVAADYIMADIIESEQEYLPTKNYRFTAEELSVASNLRDRFADNLAAIKLLKSLEETSRELTRQDAEILNHYTGWGALPQVFEYYNLEWKPQKDLIRDVLTDDEYYAAKASTPNAHYTSPEIIDFIYQSLSRMGFKNGRILEPSCGVGYFLGLMPDEMAAKSRVTAVELDSISGRIAKQLYPDADVNIQGFEDTKLINEFFDLAIGNVPFGNYRVYDPDFKKYRFVTESIHNYFFAKALQKVRVGGIVAFITSRYTMDEKDSEFREHLAANAKLISAFRFPAGAFRKIAGTDVVTDILFLQKTAQAPAEMPSWVKVAPFNPDAEYEYDIAYINQFYMDNPQNALGKIVLDTDRYNQNVVSVKSSGDIASKLSDAIHLVPNNIYTPSTTKKYINQTSANILPAPDFARNGLHIVSSGEVFKVNGDEMQPLALSADAKERLINIIGIRDAARGLLHKQIYSASSDLQSEMQELNNRYDAFVSKYGYLNKKQNKCLFRSDADYPFIISLEVWDEESETGSKADIFFARVVNIHSKAERAGSPAEALAITLSETGGYMDFNRMSALTGLSESSIIKALSAEGLIYKMPSSGEWITKDEYLSGYVKEKLLEAEIAANTDPSFKVNVDALKAVIPPDIPAEDIQIRLGSSWVPTDVIASFVEHILDEPQSITVEYSTVSATWFISVAKYSRYRVEMSAKNNVEWGTKRISAIEIIEKICNQKTIVIKDSTEQEGKYIINPQETEAAREKQYLIKAEFDKWVWSDPQRRDALVAIYNEKFNNIRSRTYDGSGFNLQGANPNITLRQHQQDAIWRILQSQTTLLAHVVGAGKTYVCAAAALECRRLGLAHKPMVVVPNHLLEQWAAEIVRLYPAANVLIAGADDFSKENRKILFSKIAANNWDAVIVGHSSFERMGVDDSTLNAFIQKEIDDLEDRILEEKADKKNNKRVVKDLEKRKKSLAANLKVRANDEIKDDILPFEALGVDMLIVDESDLFKNLGFSTKMNRIAGLPNTESNRAFDMFIKVQYLLSKGNKVVFATGTPISNTMAEMYTLQRYLQPSVLNKHGVQHFDAWAATFGEVIASFEIAPDGSGCQIRNRFARFINLPELMNMFRLFADIQTDDMINLPKPELKNGKPDIVVSPATFALKQYTGTLVKRAELIREGRVEPKQDNMLCVTNDGRKAALDMRLVFSVSDTPGSKVNKAVVNIVDIYRENSIAKGTQLVFCDLSTPKNGEFNVYHDMKEKLILNGIPESEIAFIHSAKTDTQKKSLFDRVNAGKVRVLIGSTSKMGAGMNVQKRLVALHHMDAPWRPRDIMQREGRILRQGNINNVVEIYRYVTEESFDSYIWQALENKAKFIAQVMNGSNSARTIEDIEGAALTYAEVKALASGNPMVLEKFKVENELRRFNMLKSQYKKTIFAMQNELSILPTRANSLELQLNRRIADIKRRNVPDKFSIVIDDVTYDNREAAGDAIIHRANRIRGMLSSEKIGSYAGFDLYIAPSRGGNGGLLSDLGHIVAKGAAEYSGNISSSGQGTISSLEYAVRNIETQIREYEMSLEMVNKKIKDIETEITKPFAHEEALMQLSARKEEIDKALDLDKHQSIGEDGCNANAGSNADNQDLELAA